MDLIHFICVICAVGLSSIDALTFHLPINTKKCLREEIHKNVLVTGEFELSEAPGQKTTLKVRIFIYISLVVLIKCVGNLSQIMHMVVRNKQTWTKLGTVKLCALDKFFISQSVY